MILDIVKYPNPVLNKECEKVNEITPETRSLIFDMIETHKHAQGLGLAAPQVNVSKRIIVVQLEDGAKVFLNPEIVKKSKKEEIGEEGCLCFPGLYLKIKRAESVEVKAQDSEGKSIGLKAEGMKARIFQHEIDHLNGILILNRIPFFQKWKLMRKLSKR